MTLELLQIAAAEASEVVESVLLNLLELLFAMIR